MKKYAITAVSLFLATTAVPSQSNAGHKGWYVIMGSFDYQDTDSAERRARQVNNNCGLDARWDDAIYVQGLNPNVVFVYIGPYHEKSRALAIRRVARACVSDAYVKYGRPD